jgi:hypothetical protein
MFASIRRYRMDFGSVYGLTRRVDTDFAMRIAEQPGFIAYELIDCGDGTLITISLFGQPEQAEASRSLARAWTAEHGEVTMHRIGSYHGVVWINRASEAALTPIRADMPGRFASVRRYDLRSGDFATFMRLLDSVFVDRVAAIDGFVSYQALDCGAAGWFAVSTYEDQDGAEESDEAAIEFVNEHLRGFGVERTEMIAGDVVVSRAIAQLLVPGHA